MKLLVSFALLVTVSMVSGELLQMLHLLHQHDIFHYLTPEDQVELVELIATAEACKLTAYTREHGREDITRLINHLPGAAEVPATQYIMDHLHREAAGTCVPNYTYPPETTTHHN